ncbi:MAG: hypothetical protein AB7F64_06375 [Gammaproteobacteria bacterium]
MSNNLRRIKTSKKADHRHLEATIRKLKKHFEMGHVEDCKKLMLREMRHYLETKNKSMLRSCIDIFTKGGLLSYQNLPSNEYKEAELMVDYLEIDILRNELLEDKRLMGFMDVMEKLKSK